MPAIRSRRPRRPHSRLATVVLAAAAFAALPWIDPGIAAAQDPAAAAPVEPVDAPAASQPATAPSEGDAAGAAEGERLRVIVEEVKGLVQVREGAAQPWKRASVGMELGEGAEFRTGPRSAVVCTIPPDQTIVLDRLGTVTVAEAVRRGGTTRTDLIMKYGRAEYEIEAAGAKHDATIRSPSSTLAVRGTRVNLYDQPPFTPEARSFTGRAVYQYAKRQTALGGPGRGARVRSDAGTAAESALGETVVDPTIAGARTTAENRLIASEVSRGGLVDFDNRAGINVVRNSPPLADEQLVASLPGRLNFVLRWTGDANVDLAVVDFKQDASTGFDPIPQELIFPGFGLQESFAGGVTAFDHRGGPGGGQEIVFYPSTFRTGQYGLQALFDAGEQTPITFNAFLDGEPLLFQVPQLDENGNVVTEPFTLPDGTVVQVPVLVTTESVQDTVGPEDPATPRQDELLAAVVEVPGPASAANRSAPLKSASPARVAAAAERQQKVEAKRLAEAQRRDAKTRAKLEKQAAKRLRATERASARAAAAVQQGKPAKNAGRRK
jgi:hypothetical protein